jgi:hypothetical protein
MHSNKQAIAHRLSRVCPYCFGEMKVLRLHCLHCGVVVDGAFEASPLTMLSADLQDLVVEYLKLDGSLKDLAAAQGVSYPTIRARMDKVIAALQAADAQRPAEKRQQNVLEALENGTISADEAESLLKKKEGTGVS